MAADEQAGRAATDLVGRLLAAVRHHVDVDVAYLTAYGLGGAEVCVVSGDGSAVAISPGNVVPVDQSVCLASISGQIPRTVADTQQLRATRRLTSNRSSAIGALAAAPVHLPDGTLFGALCLAHHHALPALTPATEAFLAAMAEVIGAQLEEEETTRQDSKREREAVLALFDPGTMAIALQPIVDVATGLTRGVEALSRFATSPPRPPNLWYSAAARHDLGIELEAAAASRAIRFLPELPPDWYLAVNASPSVVACGALEDVLPEALVDRVVVEITEHAAVADYDHLNRRLQGLRERGLRVAVDDAGAGFASLRHVVRLQPDIIKVDGSLIRGIDVEPLHHAMVESLAAFAHRSGATLVAESVETPAELAMLQDLGVPTAQGFLFASPCTLADLRAQYPVTVPPAFRTGV